MISIFESGTFDRYSIQNLNSARSDIITESTQYAQEKITVFISHKHDDLADLKGIIGFLENEFLVKAYIDSRDPSMPEVTSAITAETIKKRIKSCRKFILLATNRAIESKWCNWELGYGDAYKFPDNIALFPIKPKDFNDSNYKGSEYMRLYPYISFFDGTEKMNNGAFISKGYYVCTEKNNECIIKPLSEWLLKY